MVLGSLFSSLGMFVSQVLVGLLLVVPIGGLILWFCCWLYNHMAGVYGAAPRAKKSLPESQPLTTAEAGPYTAPGADILPENRFDGSNHPDAVPVPSYPWSCLIILCSALAVIIAVNWIDQLVVSGFGGKTSPATFNTIWSILPPVTLLIHTAVLALMLPTSFLRALALTMLAVLPNVAAGIALICICLWKELFVPH